MSDKDQIKELFSQKLGGYEAKVNPELWTNIASQVGATATTTAASTGMSLLTKTIIGLSAAGVITTGIVLYNTSSEDSSRTEKTTTEQSVQTSQQSVENHSTEVPANTIVASPTNTNSASVPTVQPDAPTPFEPRIAHGPVTGGPNEGRIDGVLPTNPSEQPEVGENGAERDPKLVQNNPFDNIPVNPPEAGVLENPVDATEMLVEDGGSGQVHIEDEPGEVLVETTPAVELAPMEFEIPTIFTPNRDNRNDQYYLNAYPENLKSFSFIVKDQTGETVFVSDSPDFRWDGRNIFTGEMVKKGIHAYIVIAEDENGQTYKASEYLMIEF